MDEGPSGPRGPAGERPHTLKRTARPTQTPVKHALWAREADGDLPNHGDARAVGPRASLLLASEGRLRRGAGRAHPELAPERREGGLRPEPASRARDNEVLLPGLGPGGFLASRTQNVVYPFASIYVNEKSKPQTPELGSAQVI